MKEEELLDLIHLTSTWLSDISTTGNRSVMVLDYSQISLDEGLYGVSLLVEKFKRFIDLRSNRATKQPTREMVGRWT